MTLPPPGDLWTGDSHSVLWFGYAFQASVTYFSMTWSGQTPKIFKLAVVHLWPSPLILIQLLSLTQRMRFLLPILSVAFCSAFRVSDLLEPFIENTKRSSGHYPTVHGQGYPENAAENEADDHILPVFLITFFGALFKNILTLVKEEKVVQGIHLQIFTIILFFIMLFCCCVA